VVGWLVGAMARGQRLRHLAGRADVIPGPGLSIRVVDDLTIVDCVLPDVTLSLLDEAP
jgi:hypothetical protein